VILNTMKTLLNLLCIGLTALVIIPARAADTEAVKTDMARLQGEWSMVSGTLDGSPIPETMLGEAKRVCKGDEITVTMGPQLIMKAKITLDPAKTPKTIDFQAVDGPTQGKTHLGIYELDGDTLKSCFSAPGSARPSEFTSKPGDKRTLTSWKRQKK
jgi:uncharacterized protein (TIGR03067 family)